MKNWEGEIDHNYFVSEFDRDAFTDKGCDANSIVGDPMFIDPTNGDYRLGEQSPFIKAGFKNFPMDQFGVQKQSLRAIARVPGFPTPILDVASGEAVQATEEWMGAMIVALEGEQFSAFGVKREDGGIHLVEVPADSAVAEMGFQEDDLIQRVNGAKTRTIKDLRQAMQNATGPTIRMRIVRKFQPHLIEVKQ
jgi:membrane-associated protease RseP (regulator of RpoE activity)